jgi:septal ring factor EnvC (AmiA/AmiB activator)
MPKPNPGLLAWLIRRSRLQRAALLLVMILLPAALATSFFITKIGRAQEEMEQAKKAASDWQRQYEEQQQAASRLEKELREANASLAEQRPSARNAAVARPRMRPDVGREVACPVPHKSRPRTSP